MVEHKEKERMDGEARDPGFKPSKGSSLLGTGA